MICYYRMCSIPSTNPTPMFQDNKYRLNIMCLESFVRAFFDVKPKMVFLCDYCPKEYTHLINELVPFEKEIIFGELGINGSAVKQFMMAEETKDETILFQECDYFYLPNTGKKLEEGILKLGMVSPYDHLDHYSEHYGDDFKIKLIGDVHYRSTRNNTMTFGIKGDVFREHADIFKKYGYLDQDNWKEMSAEGRTLWVPIPTFATHMISEWLAPSIKWEEEWSKYA